jgi:Kdo2-lipid IVA lauroyltransferase/acyltransferase
VRLAAFVAAVTCRFDRKHRVIARDNLRAAFPERWTETELTQLVQATYRHFFTMVVDTAFMPRKLHARNLDRYRAYVDPERRAQFYALMRSPRPVILVSAHWGNWEMGSYLLGLMGITYHAVARPLDNCFVDRFLRSLREKTGQKVLAKHGSLEQIAELLQRGENLALLADQDAGPRGLFVDFFGRPASTFKSIALLSLEYQAPILVFAAARVGQPMQYKIYFEDLILPEDYSNHPDAPRAITERYTRALERLVRRHPEQYFWLHRRWKSQPRSKGLKKQAA